MTSVHPDIDHDPRNSEIGDEAVMPCEFIDTPHNQPGEQSPPSSAAAEGRPGADAPSLAGVDDDR